LSIFEYLRLSNYCCIELWRNDNSLAAASVKQVDDTQHCNIIIIIIAILRQTKNFRQKYAGSKF